MWRLYVERQVVYGGALLKLSESGVRALDASQRKVGRILLGFASRSPSPAVMLELGWVTWSELLVGEQIRLCQRLVSSHCTYTQFLVNASAGLEGSWFSSVAKQCGVLV